jgi:tRNA(Ile)-lysidine synthase
MATSKKPRSAELAAAVAGFLRSFPLEKKRVAVGLSGGVDSVVLLDVLAALKERLRFSLSAVHVHHGLSANADAWARFCARLCKSLKVPLRVKRVRVTRAGEGLEAAARKARYKALAAAQADVLVLAHQLDDQAETVLMNLLRGAGIRGASGMPARATLGGMLLLRPLLGVSRNAIVDYARARGIEWIEDESNADEALTRNFIRRRVGPLLELRFPRWKHSLARAARHFADAELDAKALLREFLASQGLRAPTEAKLVEMLKQLTSRGTRVLVAHDGARLRLHRGRLTIEPDVELPPFRALGWSGERRVPLPALGGELRFRRARGKGVAFSKGRPFTIRLRSGGERLQPDARRPRRTLKNLFQEAGVPPWQRERMPLLFCGDDLVWAPGLGIDVRYQAGARCSGLVPEWRSPR